MISPAIPCGDFTVERTVLLGAIAMEEESGAFLRVLWVLADPIGGDAANYWKLEIGRFAAGAFKAERALPFPDGFPSGPRSFVLSPSIRFSRGDVLALRATPTGASATPLTGLSVIPEYARSGSRVR